MRTSELCAHPALQSAGGDSEYFSALEYMEWLCANIPSLQQVEFCEDEVRIEEAELNLLVQYVSSHRRKHEEYWKGCIAQVQ